MSATSNSRIYSNLRGGIDSPLKLDEDEPLPEARRSRTAAFPECALPICTTNRPSNAEPPATNHFRRRTGTQDMARADDQFVSRNDHNTTQNPDSNYLCHLLRSPVRTALLARLGEENESLREEARERRG
jgi:hypothetical protein